MNDNGPTTADVEAANRYHREAGALPPYPVDRVDDFYDQDLQYHRDVPDGVLGDGGEPK